jgi:DNA-directed RNA polymerase subunit beta
MVRVSVAQRRKVMAGDKMAGRHGNKGVVSMVVPVENMPFLEDGRPVDIILNPLGIPGRMNIGQVLETHLGWAAESLGFRAITPVFDGASEDEIEAELARAWMINEAWRVTGEKAWEWLNSVNAYSAEDLKDEEEVSLIYLANKLADTGIDVHELMGNRLFARRTALFEWLKAEGYDPAEITAFPEDHIPVGERNAQDERAVRACLQLWARSLGKELDQNLSLDDLQKEAQKIMLETGDPMPIIGKQVLRDGKTGERYDQPVTVGYMSFMKLHHLVEDKVHARATGPYSLVTQQPLGGKAQFGGQRFGEMEVWALEAYGAAHTLQEMLTVKSDDVVGRESTYQAIVTNKPIEAPGTPAAFKVLVKELQSLGLAVESIMEDGEIVSYGKESDRRTGPLPTGLLDSRIGT